MSYFVISYRVCSRHIMLSQLECRHANHAQKSDVGLACAGTAPRGAQLVHMLSTPSTRGVNDSNSHQPVSIALPVASPPSSLPPFLAGLL